MSETVELEQELPSYLRDLFTENFKCRIIISKQSILKSPEGEKFRNLKFCERNEERTDIFDENLEDNLQEYILKKSKEQHEEQINDDGMLEIDLDDGSLQLVEKSDEHMAVDFKQLTTEEYHYPLDEQSARTLLGNRYNCVKSDIPTFCIIKTTKSDPKSKHKLVILGGQNTSDFITSFSIHTYAIPLEESDSLTWDGLKKYVKSQPQSTVEYCFRRIYNIYGSEMKGIEDVCENIAAMVLETRWNEAVENALNFVQISMKLRMQVVSGHQNSSINFLWKELKHLEMYLCVLEDESALKVGDTIISDDFESASELAERIHNLCTNPVKRRKNTAFHLKLHDLHEMTILDCLWSILIHCRNLIDLKNSLSTFFRAANMKNLLDRDRAVELLKNLDVQSYLMNLTLAESLKFLVAIGCEKLKKDYFALVRFFNPIHQVGLEKIWSQYCDVKPPLTRKSLALNQPKYFALTDTTFNSEKFAFLCKLHDASEYVVFLKNDMGETVSLSDQNFSRISNEAYQKFIFGPDEIPVPESLVPSIVTVTCDLDSKNQELYIGKSPVKKIYETTYRTKNNKTHKDESVYSILVSKIPIFPKCICDFSVVKSFDDSQNPIVEPESNYFVAILRKTKCGFW